MLRYALKRSNLSMKQSKVFIPTLKETPNDADSKSHQMMLRAAIFAK
jgi:prolyl-tRNA synthetase